MQGSVGGLDSVKKKPKSLIVSISISVMKSCTLSVSSWAADSHAMTGGTTPGSETLPPDCSLGVGWLANGRLTGPGSSPSESITTASIAPGAGHLGAREALEWTLDAVDDDAGRDLGAGIRTWGVLVLYDVELGV